MHGWMRGRIPLHTGNHRRDQRAQSRGRDWTLGFQILLLKRRIASLGPVLHNIGVGSCTLGNFKQFDLLSLTCSPYKRTKEGAHPFSFYESDSKIEHSTISFLIWIHRISNNTFNRKTPQGISELWQSDSSYE